jgi:hypothetical protein
VSASTKGSECFVISAGTLTTIVRYTVIKKRIVSTSYYRQRRIYVLPPALTSILSINVW